MKKWKVLLVMLCAMLVSIGLFACKSNDDEEPVSGEDIDRVTDLKGVNNLSFTDENKWDDILTYLQSHARVECRTVSRETITVNGSDCDFEHTIDFDGDGHCKVGNYTVKAKPKQNNPKNAVSAAKTLSVTHAFGTADANNVQTCSHCFATRTYAQENSIIHYGTFHVGTNAEVPDDVHNQQLVNGELVAGDDGTAGAVFTNNNKGKTYIKDFGNVTIDGKSVKVPTLSVGQLEPGMTITVKGKAQTSALGDKVGWKAKNEAWNFPVIGIADTGLNNPVWEGNATETGSYTGGTSVFVRGEGWVLYNGVGNATENDRPLSALSFKNGTFSTEGSTYRNYGSHSNATSSDGEKRPASFTPGQIPSVNDWVDWVVYSTGNTSNSLDSYTSLTEIELTWNYRQDGIIELIYIVNGSKLTCMIKVPNATKGYYDTILHGDYVDMWIESYERIETLTPTNFTASVKSDNLYYEGQTFNPDTISASFTYKQLPDARPQALTLENIYATDKKNVTIAPIEDPKKPSDPFITTEANWVSLAENPVSTGYTYYRVKISKGGEDWYAVFPASEIHAVANKIVAAYGADALGLKNNNTVGELKIGTDGTKITLTPVGSVYAQKITDNTLTWTNGPVGEGHRYVALKIEGDLSAITSVKSGETDVPYIYNNGELLLALTADTKVVTVEGLNGGEDGTVTEFNFGTIKGFDLTSTITIGSGWYLNSAESEVTVTFTPNEGKTLGIVNVGGQMFRSPTDLITNKTTDYKNSYGFSFDADKTKIEGDTLTIVVKFTAANLLNYAARSISVYIGRDVEFDYKIDYKPEFAKGADDIVDANYYTFVEGGKIYLAKMAEDATDGNNALTLNLNAGNDKIALLNLAYNYNATAGTATLRNEAELTGAAISVVKIAGTDMILIEIDPAQNGINGTTYGYQLKTGAAYSASYFAVSGNTVTKATVTTTESLIINEGSCQETGLSGYINESGEVTFVATPTEFAGKHSSNIANAGDVCQYCGQTAQRKRPAVSGDNPTATLHDNEFLEFWGSFASVDQTLTEKNEYPMWNGLVMQLVVGNKSYRIRNDGPIIDWALNTAVEDSKITSSLDKNNGARTPVGRLDADGVQIREADFLATLNAGATFRVWAGYQDGTFTTTWRFYKAGEEAQGKVYFEFTHKFEELDANALTLNITLEKATMGENSGNVFWMTGVIDKTAITNAEKAETTSNVTLAVGGIENHFAVVTATGGNATLLTPAVKNELGITDADGYTKYVKVAIAINKDNRAYTDGNAVAKVYTDAAFEHLRKGAKAEFNEDKDVLTVTIALGAGEDAPGTYYIDLKNNTAHNLQNDIKLDLSAVSMYSTKGTVDKTGISLIKGGDLVINYNIVSQEFTNLKVKLGDSEAVPAATFKLGKFDATWETITDDENYTHKLTITVPPQSKIENVPEYVVSLLDGDKTAVTNKVIPDAPTVGENETDVNLFKHEDVYGYAEGDKLYLYLFGESATGKNYLVFNANNAATIANANETLMPYSLAHSVNDNLVTFTSSNDLTDAKNASNERVVAATHVEGGSFKLTQFVIDLSYFKINADAQYYCYVLTTENEGAYFYSVDVDNEGRKITNSEVDTSVSPVQAAKIDCTKIGSQGYAITDGESILGFSGLEVVPMTHDWTVVANGGGQHVCSKCGAVAIAGNAKNAAVGSAVLAPITKGEGENQKTESIVETGITVSFEVKATLVTAPGDDWSANTLVPTGTGLIITLPNLDPWNNTVASLKNASQRDKDLAKKFKGVNAFPGASEYKNNAGWNVFNGTSYATFVISQESGIQYYRDGVLVVHYAADRAVGTGKVAEYAELFLSLTEKVGLTIGAGTTINAVKDALVQRIALTEKQVAERYQSHLMETLPTHTTHTYVNDKCACGALDPEHGTVESKPHVDNSNPKDWKCDICGATITHTHTYENGVCTQCNEPCSHDFNATTGECSNDCGMKRVAMAEQTYTAANFNAGYIDAADTAKVVTRLQNGCEVTFRGKLTSECSKVYFGITVQIWKYGTSYARGSECAFLQGNGWCLDGSWTNKTSGNGIIIPGSGSATLESLGDGGRNGFTYEITVAFNNGTVTVTYKAWSGATTGNPTHTGVSTYKNVTEKELAVAFGPDGTTLADGITINGTEIVNKTPATPEA
ncbi:MAG: hypothetical protein K2L02_05955 [Clostridia bacterium]|nr:hypothetical protein [Clostridia bacterium]